uniref:Putative ribonuclease H-like domain-containing protein n=1 Tax=Tanacetum cinerariifolium TaxID=118510 RepID=A0A6L2KK74_TANCI|nr:putative ribonuclease H-like domain-containing protein [Tanacetum cinerariifolium]
MENLNEVKVKELRSKNGTEFRIHKLKEFCDEKGISQNFSSPCTPEQNGVAERRNKTLIEAARTMLYSANLPKQFWGEGVNTACYIQNISIIVKRRMILEPGHQSRKVPINETFHEQTGDELTENELKQVEADDQAIQTILLGLPEEIYAVVDSCKTV